MMLNLCSRLIIGIIRIIRSIFVINEFKGNVVLAYFRIILCLAVEFSNEKIFNLGFNLLI